MPILRCDENRPRIGLSAGASLDFDAFGGIFGGGGRFGLGFLGVMMFSVK
jgi:hypothetical protein